ncbi:hypothetical protein GHT06_018644 [Daphnia sinensis]|uniref:Uncharacterized protein n=1 Tax=Daphnia sinensis TaxID=1820382 RepID=A0AAD5KMT2_9CRUS|nr:hypothetical protein GHT06_018644 [Daphnia sinensis]
MVQTKKTVCSPSQTKSSKTPNAKSTIDPDEDASETSASNTEPEPSANDTNLKSCWV